MRIIQPDAPNSPPKSPCPLELAIYQFEQKAKGYHQLKTNSCDNLSANKRAELDNQLECNLRHLKSERERISILSKLQANLESYRKSSTKSDAVGLLKEKHHPTDKLANHLRAVGEPRPGLKHDAHHIIPGKGRWQQKPLIAARLNLHFHGVGIHDPLNGVWLPRNREDKGHWATPKAPAHKEIHRYNYETWISRKFSVTNLSKGAFIASLRDIKRLLKYGGYDAKITAKKDPNWVG
jgi:A nuclease family of the HNH/ENDO VII superfamily with conserved AHH